VSVAISNGTDEFSPLIVTRNDYSRPNRNILHAIIGSNEPAVTLRELGLRKGTMQLRVADAAAEVEATTILGSASVKTYTDSVTASESMSFVIDGDVRTSLDSVTLLRRVIEFDYAEVSP